MESIWAKKLYHKLNFHALLAICPNSLRLLEEFAQLVKYPDQLIWLKARNDKKQISIEQIRELLKLLKLKPFNQAERIIIAINLIELSTVSAHSLLKILEEPPKYAIFLLAAENDSAILPTIRSRCQVIRFNQAKQERIDIVQLNKVRKMPDWEKIQLANELSQLDARVVLDQWLLEARQIIVSRADLAEKIYKIRQRLNSNQNKRLIIERLILDL